MPQQIAQDPAEIDGQSPVDGKKNSPKGWKWLLMEDTGLPIGAIPAVKGSGRYIQGDVVQFLHPVGSLPGIIVWVFMINYQLLMNNW